MELLILNHTFFTSRGTENRGRFFKGQPKARPSADRLPDDLRLWYASTVIETIQQNRRAIADACRQFGVGRLEVFGSAARGDFNAQESDLDFIANFLPPLHPGVADRFFGLADALERIFSRPVDLLTDAMIRNPVLREEVNRNRSLIYDHGGQEKTP